MPLGAMAPGLGMVNGFGGRRRGLASFARRRASHHGWSRCGRASALAAFFIVSAMRLRCRSTLITRTFTRLPTGHDLVRIAHVAVGELRHVHEPVLVHADVDERAEGDDVRHDALELHPLAQVLRLGDVVAERRRLERRARIAARLAQLGEDVAAASGRPTSSDT